MSINVNVFFVSDRTGITAETLGNSLLTQFDGIDFRKSTLPFINTVEKARSTVDYINHLTETSGSRPILVSTTVSDDIRAILRGANSLFLDLFDTFIPVLELELNLHATNTAGRAHGVADTKRYYARIDAMNFALEHDDGQSSRGLASADIILIAPSRCGKTPTTLYLAMQHGIFAANFPLIEEDLEDQKLPRTIVPLSEKLFGLIVDPDRLHQIRSERRPGSEYASLRQCSFELRQAEAMYRRLGIPYVNSTTMSIEEIATLAMQEKGIRKQSF